MSVANKGSHPFGLRWRSSTLFICSTVGVGAFTDLFLYALIVPVLPFLLQDRIHIPVEEVQDNVSFLLALFAAASVIASPIAGILADKSTSSRQLPYVLGLVLLIAATVLLAVGTSIPVLAIARILQGASGGTVWTIGLAILIETVGQDNLGTAIGSIFSVITVGALFGPIVGGLLYSKTGYNGVFGVGVAVVFIDLVMRLLMIEKKVATRYDQDASRMVQNGSAPDDENTPLLNGNLAPDWTEYRLVTPKSSITKNFPILLVLADPALLTAFCIGFIQALLLGSFDATVPLVAADHYGFDSLKAGLLFIPLGGADFLFGPVFGWCVDRFGTRPVSIIGFIWLIPTLVLLRLPTETFVTKHLDYDRNIALYIVLLAINGLGLAIINSTSIVEAGDIVEKYYKANVDIFVRPPYAQLYGISSMVWSGGMTVGPLLAGFLRASIGYGNMNAVLAGLCVFTTILILAFIGKRRRGGYEIRLID